MTIPGIIFEICVRNDVTVTELSDMTDIPAMKLALAMEWRVGLGEAQKARLINVGQRLKRRREAA
ncbi:MAG: hypothetical protein IH969_08735 [Candidatus Krumholzibacteriota bacterium]|nr:hypothetical protein [Candidatus Krumholzibacteriota bacterium]